MNSNADSSPPLLSTPSDVTARIAAHHYSETVDFQRMRAAHSEGLTQGISKVLVIYTGGTIGMKHEEASGYSPAKGYLPEKLRSIDRFHDSEGFKDFEIEFHRSNSVENESKNVYAPNQTPRALIEQAKRKLLSIAKENSTRFNGADQLESRRSLESHHATDFDESTPSHRESSESAHSEKDSTGSVSAVAVSERTDSLGIVHQSDEEVIQPAASPSKLSEWLITPKSMYGRRTQYCFLEYDPLLDSCNMDMSDWVRIVSDVERFYSTFDAFVILHGTDTMAYTASALSFMLQNIGKSVIVTGSQVPIAEVRNDGIENFLGALTIAGHFVIPEVSLYFNNKLFRGNRCTKIDAMDFDAFGSPNLAPLVKVGVDIEVNWPEVLRPNAIEPFCAHKQMNTNVATLRLFPGITATAIRAFLASSIQGVVLETFGAGNAPDTRPNILEALTEASDRGVVIVNVTQCPRGNVSDLYATARGLTNAKVVPGRDMTSECALTKLSYLLGRGFSPEKCRSMLSKSLRGELTVIQAHSRPIYYSGHGRTHTFTQFVSTQILEENRAADSSIDPPPVSATGSPHFIPLARTMSEASAAHLSGTSTPVARETVAERASIYRSFFPVLLCAAAATGDLQGMYLLEAAANNHLEVTCYDYTGQTPLHCAARAGNLPCARFLLKRGASVHVLSRQGHTPLFSAAASRHPEMISMLLKAGAHFSDAETKDLMANVQNAVARGDIEFVKLVVNAGFDVNQVDLEGRSVLFFAVVAAQVEIVEYLLGLPGIKVEVWDGWGYSPVDYVLRKLEVWGEGGMHEDGLEDMREICDLFCNAVSIN